MASPPKTHPGRAFRTLVVLALLVATVAGPFGLFAPAATAQSGGFALLFDGVNDYVSLGSTSTMIGSPGWTTGKTIEAWIKPDGSAPAVAPETGKVILGNDSPRSFGMSRANYGGADRIWVWNNDGAIDRLGTEAPLGQWTHIALVHNGATLSLYRNGELVGSTASGATASQGNGGQLYMGGSGAPNRPAQYFFGGQIDEVRIWSTALDQGTLAAWMSVPVTAQHPNWGAMAAYYRMSDGVGTSLTDDRGNGRTGALNGGMGDANWATPGALADNSTPNTRPVADAQSVTVAEDTAANITLTGSDADNDPLTFRIVTQPANGAIFGTPPSVTYTPAANYSGADSFTFTVNDGRLDAVAATVSLTVTPVNDPPTAQNDSASTAQDAPVTVNVLANDSDPDGDTLTITAVGSAANGSTAISGNAVVYTPNAGFTGADSFSYTISDGNGGIAGAQVAITVQAVGDAGYALSFDGDNNYVRFTNTATILGPTWTTSKSVLLWTLPEGTATVPQRNDPAWCDALFSDRPRWWGASRCPLNGLDRMWFYNFDASGYDLIGVPYTPGQWAHFALVHDNGLMSVYKNGVLQGSVPSGATVQPNTGALPVLHLGGVSTSSSRVWMYEGDIDEFSLWKVGLSQSAIQAWMNRELSTSHPNWSSVAAYYKMSDGAGTTLTDDSGHGFDGQLLGGMGNANWVGSGAFSAAAAAAAAADVEGAMDTSQVVIIIDMPRQEDSLWLPAIQR